MKAPRRSHFRALLEGERDRILDLLRAATAVPASIANGAPGEESLPGVAGAEPIDDTALIAQQSAALAETERALQLLRDDPDRYGVCVECGEAIADSRLELIPTARRCARHADSIEQFPIVP